MNKGKIKAYSKNKKYGFIVDENNQEVFFHFDNLLNKDQEKKLLKDAIVAYEESITKKGLRALKVNLVKETKNQKKNKSKKQNNKKYDVKFLPRFFMNKMPEPKRGKILLKVEFKTAGYRSVDKAKSALINTAKELGFNAVLGYYHDREKLRCDNYIYNLNSFRGYFCVVVETKKSNKPQKDFYIDLEKMEKDTKKAQFDEYFNHEEERSRPKNTSKSSQRPEWGDFQAIKTAWDFFTK